jgi:allantoinase
VKPGDSRYKTAPPIRDHENYLQLWNLIRNNEIDCISSYHQPVAPPEKFIGDFFKAKCGMTSIGFTLQAAWTRLRAQIAIEDEGFYLALLVKMLSEQPAKVLGIEDRGCIAVGKKADLVVWDPDCKFKVSKTFDKYPEMSPMLGEELYGVVHKTFLSGIMTYSIDN